MASFPSSYQPPLLQGSGTYDVENAENEEFVSLNQKDSDDPHHHQNQGHSPQPINASSSQMSSSSHGNFYAIAVPETPDTPDIPIREKRVLFIWLIVCSIIYGFCFLASLFLCLMSVMFFDAGVTLQALVAVAIVLSIPFLIILIVISSWKAYNRRNYRLVILFNMFPTLLIVASILSSFSS